MSEPTSISRRHFLQGTAATLLGFTATASLAEDAQTAAASHGKAVSFLDDGDFTGSAWGWQFTPGAQVQVRAGRTSGSGAIHVRADANEYARFLVLGPTAGKTYTVSGWVRTDSVRASEPGGGAYVSASQFEFQGRPTEFTVDGKQAVEPRFANTTGTTEWHHFSQSVKCLPTTAWFEIVVGIFRGSGEAWFSGLTFTQGSASYELADTISPREAAHLAHTMRLASAARRSLTRARAAILHEPGLPIRGAASDPNRLRILMLPTHDGTLVPAATLANPTLFNRSRFDLLVLATGESFPLPAHENVLRFLAEGGDLLTSGGYAFQSPCVLRDGSWRFLDEVLAAAPAGVNLIPPPSDSAWKRSSPTLEAEAASLRVHVPTPRRMASEDWSFDLPARGEGRQFRFSAMLSTTAVEPAPDGAATLGVEQLDSKGELAYAARVTFEELRGTVAPHLVSRIFYLVPDCVTLRVRLRLYNSTGAVEARDLRLEEIAPAVRINTALGWPEDSLTVNPAQLGLFDADFRLRRVASLATCPVDGSNPARSDATVTGYAASGVVGMNHARWIPVLQAADAAWRPRGAAAAIMHHYAGPYTGSSWAFFGIDSEDVFAPDGPSAAHAALSAALEILSCKCFLHTAETSFATYRDGEPVRVRVLVSNFGRVSRDLKVRIGILTPDRQTAFQLERPCSARPGETIALETDWVPTSFAASHYTVETTLLQGSHVLDRLQTGFNVWQPETLTRGLKFTFRENYFQVDGRSVFLQGTDDYLHTFIDQDENPGTWLADARGCRDSAIDVYENLLGLRGPGHRPTETWWRWVDAMLLNTQAVGGAFFPGMLVFSNTAVVQADLDDQTQYVRAFAERYRDAAGLMYYLNGDLELHDPNLPELQALYHDFLRRRYGPEPGTELRLREAWHVSPPEGPIGTLAIHGGTTAWNDVRTLDDFKFRTELVRRWLNAMHDSIREVDTVHPVTAEFYQEPVSGTDLLTALGKLDLANFGYFAEKEEDRYRFPQVCRFLDQSMRGKGINVGEFGVKTHPAWKDTGYYIEARTEQYEQRYFLSLSHYAFALGASKIQNWCWKYPADLPFEWGINYPNDMVPRDVRAFYRNSGLLFRSLRPRFEASETVMLLASDARMGGQGKRIVEGQLNAIRLLMDRNIRFATLTDEFLDELPATTRTILYPLPFCPSDSIVERLITFVRGGGRLYLSGDISLDSLRERTRTERLRELCGVDFVRENYSGLDFGRTSVPTSPLDAAWPAYAAAPTMVLRSAGARTVVSAPDGSPIVAQHTLGSGTVLFSADPVELHGDPRFHRYGHQFYTALAQHLRLTPEAVEAPGGEVHCFRVPQQDDRVVTVLANYGEAAAPVTLPSETLVLAPHTPGIVVRSARYGVEAVESSGDVLEGGKPLVSADLQFVAIAFPRRSLRTADRVLLLPMGTGSITLHGRSSIRQPVLLSGEIAGGRWRQWSVTRLEPAADGSLTFPVGDANNLSMLILCDEPDAHAATAAAELWIDKPWMLEEAT